MQLIVGQDVASIREYRAAFPAPQGVMSYASLANVTRGLDAPTDYGSGVEFASAALDVAGAGASLQLGLYVAWSLEAIVAGALDANIDLLRAYLAALAPRKAYVRIGYEFDNPDNRHAPGPYKEAFRRIATRLKTETDNVRTVWHSWCFEPWAAAGGAGIAAWWPGADVVDYCGVSLFQNVYPDSPLGDLTRARDVVDFCRARGKPTVVAESTPFGLGTPAEPAATIWDRWFARALDFMNESGIEVWSYINTDWDAQPMWQGEGWGDTRVQRYPAVRDRWIADVLSHTPGSTSGDVAPEEPPPPHGETTLAFVQPGSSMRFPLRLEIGGPSSPRSSSLLLLRYLFQEHVWATAATTATAVVLALLAVVGRRRAPRRSRGGGSRSKSSGRPEPLCELE